MYLIRSAEKAIREYYPENEMKTPMHMSMGEEAIAVGVCHALKEKDQVFGTYRSHAIFLAKTGDIGSFFAEMYGRDTSPQKGKGGSMHLCLPQLGFMGASAIVGSIIPVAVGAAYANKVMGNKKIVVVFFGDGATDEGAFWESLNFACLKQLPILFVCEDNGLAVHTPKSSRRGYTSLTNIVSRFECNVCASYTTDVEAIYDLTIRAIESIKECCLPCFMQLEYYRYLEHVGVEEDFDAGYRARGEFQRHYEVDPVNLQRCTLLDSGCAEETIVELELEIDTLIEQSICTARQAPFPAVTEVYKGVYV
jgi:pyruvate dehydrogenase E1 component alpha subunit